MSTIQLNAFLSVLPRNTFKVWVGIKDSENTQGRDFTEIKNNSVCGEIIRAYSNEYLIVPKHTDIIFKVLLGADKVQDETAAQTDTVAAL